MRMFGELATRCVVCADELERSDADDLWAAVGALSLTGWPDRPLVPPISIPRAVAQIGAQVNGLSAELGLALEVDALSTLVERSAYAGLVARGDVSCGGSTRLLPTRDQWLAASLARPSDLELIPAWVGRDIRSDPWESLAAIARGSSGRELADRGRLLGLPVAVVGSVGRNAGPAVQARCVAGEPGDQLRIPAATVVDLSSLWAGPLCGRLLTRAGARVIKVESRARPDGARLGNADFYDALHAGQESVALDFGDGNDRGMLLELVRSADIVIEASRPRALDQLGIDRQHLLATGRPRIWLSVTGYGFAEPASAWTAFGDDAAAAGGLVGWDDERGPCFFLDAVADPLTGLVATAAVLAASKGGSWHLDVALARVAAAVAGDGARIAWRRTRRPALPPPSGVPPSLRAPRLGRDTTRLRRELGLV